MGTMDESLIHAFLDDELDPESRRSVEEEARSDAGAAREIGELARLKSLIANGHRPADPPVDVSGAVVSQIRREDARRRARQPIAAATVLALAALLMITFVWSRPAPPDNAPQMAVLNQEPAISPDPVGETRVADQGAESEGAGGLDNPAGGPTAWTSISLAELDTSDPLPAEQREAQAFLIDLVDRPRSRSIVIEADPGISADALADSLDGVLLAFGRNDPRYGRLSEAGTPPGSDAVFVLLAGDLEREDLRSRILEELGDRCRILDPPEADLDANLDPGNGDTGSPTLLVGPGSFVLREVGRFSRLGPGQGEVMANRQHPQDVGLIMPNVVVGPPMHDDPLISPPVLPVHPPTPPDLGDAGAEPTSSAVGTPAEVIVLRVKSAE